MEYDEFRAMNSQIVLAAEGDEHAVQRGFVQARAFIAESEARLTRFSDSSELAQLNRAAGEWKRVAEPLYELVSQAQQFTRATHGLFDPTILDALEAAGYDKSMDAIRAHGAALKYAMPILERADMNTIQFHAKRRALRLPRGMRLDLGGIAKGWIAERAAEVLAGYARAGAVSAGGDMFLIGLPQGETAWGVELEDPRDATNTLALLRVGPGAVATSSVTKRRWQRGDQVMHHLIDPRTGLPAQTDWLSVTVIAPHATTAEVFAKALLIGGSSEAKRIAAERSDMAFLTVNADGQVWDSRTGEFNRNDEIEYA